MVSESNFIKNDSFVFNSKSENIYEPSLLKAESGEFSQNYLQSE